MKMATELARCSEPRLDWRVRLNRNSNESSSSHWSNKSAQLAWLAGCHVLTYFNDTTVQPPEQAETQAAQGYRYGWSHKRSITMLWCSFETSAVQAPDNVGQWEQGCSDYIKSDNTYP